MSTATGALSRDLYGLLTGDEDARVCTDISDAACNDQPRNLVLQLAARSASKIADHLVDAKLVLPWLLSALAWGASGAIAVLSGCALAGGLCAWRLPEIR